MIRVNLALQGGGAHGAFTWGVLDRLLSEPDVEIHAISGASAGALNGAAFKSGWVKDGRNGARTSLNWLWEQMGAVGDLRMSEWMKTLFPIGAMTDMMEANPLVQMGEVAKSFVSPYDYGVAYRNPLGRIARRLSYDRIHTDIGPELHVGATNVRTGKLRLFTGDDITPEAILASACLPTVFQAIEIFDQKTGRDESYWDGGYTGNPALFPLFEPHLPDDIIVVNINPLHREEVPTSAMAIQNRVNEISFNTSLLRELRAISFVKDLLHSGAINAGTMKDVKVHMISDDLLMNELSVATKMMPTPHTLGHLREAGFAAADQFLIDHKAKLGKESSVNLREMFD